MLVHSVTDIVQKVFEYRRRFEEAPTQQLSDHTVPPDISDLVSVKNFEVNRVALFLPFNKSKEILCAFNVNRNLYWFVLADVSICVYDLLQFHSLLYVVGDTEIRTCSRQTGVVGGENSVSPRVYRS